jgi:hypothetical protein
MSTVPPQLVQAMVPTRSARASISTFERWRTKPFSTMNEPKVEKRPCRAAQR